MTSDASPSIGRSAPPEGTFLERILDETCRRNAFERTVRPLPYVMEGCMSRTRRTGFPFKRALGSEGMSFICEMKRASPSKGTISEDFPYMEIARDYESAGASAISVLTEPRFFRGSDRYLEEVSDSVGLPVLRKDFIVDEYQVYRAKEMGASAVLLIAAALDDRMLSGLRRLAESLGMSALVEAHDRDEVERAVSCGSGIIGINNRDLGTFEVDIRRSLWLRDLIPDGVIAVSESGMRTADDVRMMADAGYDAVLVGETLMRSADRRAALGALRP